MLFNILKVNKINKYQTIKMKQTELSHYHRRRLYILITCFYIPLFRFRFSESRLLLVALLVELSTVIAVTVACLDDSSLCKISGCLRNRKYTQSK